MTLATIEALRRMPGLVKRGRDDSHTACIKAIVMSAQHLIRAGQLTPSSGFETLDRQGHVELVKRLVDCASRPYDSGHPEHYDYHPPAIAFEALLALCHGSPFIAQIARQQRAFEPLAAALFSHLRRAQDASEQCRQAMRSSFGYAFSLVQNVLLNTPDVQDERASNWSSSSNPFALLAA